MKNFYQYSVKLYHQDGTFVPVAAYYEDTARSLAKHALKTGEFIKAVCKMRRLPEGNWFRIWEMEQPVE